MHTSKPSQPTDPAGTRPDIAAATHTRNARATDLPQLLQMICQLARHHHDTPELTLEQLRGLAFGPDKWISIIVAEQISDPETAVVGYAALCPRIQLQLGTRGMDLHHLFVSRDMRGQGMGRLLIRAAENLARARGCSYMSVGTHPENITAQHTYLAQGFTRLPGAANHFKRGLDLD